MKPRRWRCGSLEASKLQQWTFKMQGSSRTLRGVNIGHFIEPIPKSAGRTFEDGVRNKSYEDEDAEPGSRSSVAEDEDVEPRSRSLLWCRDEDENDRGQKLRAAEDGRSWVWRNRNRPKSTAEKTDPSKFPAVEHLKHVGVRSWVVNVEEDVEPEPEAKAKVGRRKMKM
jgi:hypothetical protein